MNIEATAIQDFDKHPTTTSPDPISSDCVENSTEPRAAFLRWYSTDDEITFSRNDLSLPAGFQKFFVEITVRIWNCGDNCAVSGNTSMSGLPVQPLDEKMPARTWRNDQAMVWIPSVRFGLTRLVTRRNDHFYRITDGRG
jgi:hypothetical protein